MSEPKCYTTAQVRAKLQIGKNTFWRLRATGQLPFLEELKPPIGKRLRFRADLVDRYLSGQWQAPRLLTAHRKIAG